jgi:hypothetical protein
MWIRQSSRSHIAEDVQFRFDRGWRRLRRRNPDRREFGFCALDKSLTGGPSFLANDLHQWRAGRRDPDRDRILSRLCAGYLSLYGADL